MKRKLPGAFFQSLDGVIQAPGGLKLVDHFVSDKGVVFTTHEPAGEMPTGSSET
jgi:hypothetical protein